MEKSNVIHIANQLSFALKDYHRSLLFAQAGDDPVLRNPYSMLFAVIQDPRFSWTSQLAQLIVQLDEALAEDEIATVEQLEPFRGILLEMLGIREEKLGEEKKGEDKPVNAERFDFYRNHVNAVQRNPDVALATGVVRKALAALPAVKAA